MIVVFGTRLKRYTQGYAPGWNPLKGEPCWMRVDEVCKNWHIYYIDLGKGETIGIEVVPAEGPEIPMHDLYCDTSTVYVEPVGDPLDLMIRDSTDFGDSILGAVEIERVAHSSLPGGEERNAAINGRFEAVHHASVVITERSIHESVTAVVGLLFICFAISAAIFLYMGQIWGWFAVAAGAVTGLILLWRTTYGLAKYRWLAIAQPLTESLLELGVDAGELTGLLNDPQKQSRTIRSMIRHASKRLNRIESQAGY
ncbi:MAG: hypothetical protein Phyf2KO_12530 [Phycisphaerales bacterium]